MDLDQIVLGLTREVSALTSTVRENNNFLKDFIKAQRHCNQLVEDKIHQIELHGSKPAEEALKQITTLSAKVELLETCSTELKSIVSRLPAIIDDVETLKDASVGKNAVKSWWDWWITKAVVIGSALLGLIAFLREVF